MPELDNRSLLKLMRSRRESELKSEKKMAEEGFGELAEYHRDFAKNLTEAIELVERQEKEK